MLKMRAAMSAWAVALLLFLPSAVMALPDVFMQEGFLTDARGRPFDGPHNITVRLYEVARDGMHVFEEVHQGVNIENGYYAVAIGSIEPLDGTLFDGDVFLTIRIDAGDFLEPRIQLGKVPAAFDMPPSCFMCPVRQSQQTRRRVRNHVERTND